MEFSSVVWRAWITSWLCLMDFVYICRRSVSQQWAGLLERVDGSQRELWQYHGASLHGGQIGWEGRRERYHGEERIGRGWQTSITLGFCRWEYNYEHNFESQGNKKGARASNETQLKVLSRQWFCLGVSPRSWSQSKQKDLVGEVLTPATKNQRCKADFLLHCTVLLLLSFNSLL